MTLIQRQDGIVRLLENLYRRKWQNPGLRSRAVRLVGEFNTKRMVFAGYTPAQAKESFRQCVDIAILNLTCEVLA